MGDMINHTEFWSEYPKETFCKTWDSNIKTDLKQIESKSANWIGVSQDGSSGGTERRG